MVHEGEDPHGGGRRHEGCAEEEEESVGVAEEVSEDVVEDAVLVLGLLLLQDDYRVTPASAAAVAVSAATVAPAAVPGTPLDPSAQSCTTPLSFSDLHRSKIRAAIQ